MRLVSWYRLFHDFIRFAIKFPIYVSPVAGVDFSDVHPASDFCHLHGLFASVGANLENAVENESGLDFVNPLFRLLRIGFEPRFQPADRCPRFGSPLGAWMSGILPSNSAMRRSIASRFNFTSVPIALNFVSLLCFLRYAALFRIIRPSYRRYLKLAANRLNFICPDRSHS